MMSARVRVLVCVFPSECKCVRICMYIVRLFFGVLLEDLNDVNGSGHCD